MFKILETAVDSVIEMEVEGEVTAEDYEVLEEAIKDKLKETDQVNILCRVKELSKITAQAILEDFKLGVKHYKNIGKIAVVSSEDWTEWITKLSAILPVESKHFDTEEIDEAWSWVKNE